MGIVGAAARSPEDLVLGGHLLKVGLEALVLDGGLLLSIFEIGELGLEVFDVPLLALTERSLARKRSAQQFRFMQAARNWSLFAASIHGSELTQHDSEPCGATGQV